MLENKNSNNTINIIVAAMVIAIALLISIFIFGAMEEKRSAALEQCENGVKEACEYIYAR